MDDFLSELTSKVLNGYSVSRDDALALTLTDIDGLSACADEIRSHFCGSSFSVCSIVNVKSGLCSEDCSFCSQSIFYDTAISIYPLLNDSLLENYTRGLIGKNLRRIGYVSSGRRLCGDEFESLTSCIEKLCEEYDYGACVSLGFLTESMCESLKACNVSCVHCNLETSEKYFKNICSTHEYGDKLKTIRNARKSTLTVCSGGIFGLGESWEDRIELALTLRSLNITSIPINILNPIRGTPLADNDVISNDELCRIVALYRFINPESYIRLAGGRLLLEDNGRRAFQSGANAAIMGDMLTTSGVDLEEDLSMIRSLGYHVSFDVEV